MKSTSLLLATLPASAATSFTSAFEGNTGAVILPVGADNSSGSATLTITDWQKDISVTSISGLTVINRNNGVAADGGFVQLTNGTATYAYANNVFVNENANVGTAPRQRGFSLTFTLADLWDLDTLTVLFGHASGSGTDQEFSSTLIYRLSGGALGASITGSSLENYANNPAYHTVPFDLTGTALGAGTCTLEVYQEGNTNGSYAIFDGITLTATAIPEPATAFLAVVGLFGLLRRRNSFRFPRGGEFRVPPTCRPPLNTAHRTRQVVAPETLLYREK